MRSQLALLALAATLFAGCSSNSDDGDAADASSPSSDNTGQSSESGGSEATGEEEVVVELLAAEFAASDDPNALQYDDDQARCAAEGMVEQLGLARLEELGVDPVASEVTEDPIGNLTEEESVAVYDVIAGCTDTEGQIVELLRSDGMPEEQATCVAERYLQTDLPRRALMSGYDPELNAEIDAALAEAETACGG